MTSVDARFAGKVALVTGSARGIGRAIALRLADEGADIVVNYRKHAEEAEKAAALIESMGCHALPLRADVGQPEEIERMFEEIGHNFDGLDFLICNAAAGIQNPLQETTLKAWDLAMNVNARSYLLCAQAAFPMLKARGGGRIVALTTRALTEQAGRLYGSVAASKAAINALTVYLAVEFGPHNIIVNAVSPGMVDTDALAYFQIGPEMLERAKELTPSGRVTTEEDVAHLVAFLCSDEAHQINGQIVEIDGGYRRLFH